jgi:elongation factor 2
MYEGVAVQRVAVVMGKKIESFESVPCGNTVALVGIDNYMSKSCTVVSSPKSFPMVNMKFSVAPVMRVAVRTKDPKDLPKLVEGI